MASSVLIFGYDERLLSSRRWVLESQGFRVLTTGKLLEASQILGTERIELLILCQTLSAEDYEGALAVGRLKQPEMGILAIDADGSRHTLSVGATILSDFPTPGAFIAAVQEMAGPQGVPLPGVS
jgi:hypothetical protein